MALQFDAASNGAATDTTLTVAHIMSASRGGVLIACAGIESGNDWMTGATFNGVAMTQINKQASVSTNEYLYVYGLVAPASGTHDIVFSSSNSVVIRSVNESLIFARPLQPDATSKDTQNTTSLTVSTTINTVNSWLLSVAQGDAATPTAGTGVVQVRATQNNVRLGDSDGPLSAGSHSMTWTNGAAINLNVINISIAAGSAGNFFIVL